MEWTTNTKNIRLIVLTVDLNYELKHLHSVAWEMIDLTLAKLICTNGLPVEVLAFIYCFQQFLPTCPIGVWGRSYGGRLVPFEFFFS